MRRLIKFIAASIAIVVTYGIGSVAFAQPASATFCIPIAARGEISYSSETTFSAPTTDSLDSATATVDGVAVDDDVLDYQLAIAPLPDPEPLLRICGPVIIIKGTP